MNQASHWQRKLLANRPAFRVTDLAAACFMAVAGAGSALAQQAPAPAGVAGAAGTQTIVVRGIRSSLESSLAMKRDGQRVVDGISAEDRAGSAGLNTQRPEISGLAAV